MSVLCPLYTNYQTGFLYKCTLKWFSVQVYSKLVFCTIVLWTRFLYTCTLNSFSVQLYCKLAFKKPLLKLENNSSSQEPLRGCFITLSDSEFQNTSLTSKNQIFYLAFFWQIFDKCFGFRHAKNDLGWQYQTIPYQSKTFYTDSRSFWPICWAKVPKSEWIWFGDTYPLNQWVVLSWKILVSPFWHFQKTSFWFSRHVGRFKYLNINNRRGIVVMLITTN